MLFIVGRHASGKKTKTADRVVCSQTILTNTVNAQKCADCHSIIMYSVSAQGIVGRVIHARYYYYYWQQASKLNTPLRQWLLNAKRRRQKEGVCVCVLFHKENETGRRRRRELYTSDQENRNLCKLSTQVSIVICILVEKQTSMDKFGCIRFSGSEDIVPDKGVTHRQTA